MRPAASTWTTSTGETFPTTRRSTRGLAICTTLFFSKVVTQTFKRVPWRTDKILSKHCRCSLGVRTEQGRENTAIPKDQGSRQNDQLDQVIQENWSGYVETGKKFSLKNHQLLRRHGHRVGGVVRSGKKDAGKNTIWCKADEQCSLSKLETVATL